MIRGTVPILQHPEPALPAFELIGQRVWHGSTPKRIVRHCTPGRSGDGWMRWIEHLVGRKKPAGLERLLPGTSWPLAWNLPDSLAGSATEAMIDRLAGAKQKSPGNPWLLELLEPWLAEASGAGLSDAIALESLAVAHALPRMGLHVSALLWWELLEHLLRITNDAEGMRLNEAPLAHQILAGELPLALAYHFPEVNACRTLFDRARRNLSQGPLELLDGEGLPMAEALGALRPLLSCWTRALAVSGPMKKSCLGEDAMNQYEWFVRNAIRLTRHDGSQMFSTGSAGAWNSDLFLAAMRLGANAEDRKAAEAMLPGWKTSGKRPHPVELPEPAVNSEWSALAVLRPDWTRSGPRLAVQYRGRQVELELQMGRQLIFSGCWGLEVEAAGVELAVKSDWEEVCWVSDDDVDYLELEAELGNGVRVGRQILLARQDRFLFLSDTILGRTQRGISYHATLPLAPAARFSPAEETREGWLGSDKPVAMVMPLALPEWRADPRHGSLTESEGSLELQQATAGGNLFCPLFIDLDRRRAGKATTWRQLTVAEKLDIQTPEVAVGYRVQCGREQWLFYRSLAETANRTVLGQNLASEFLCAQFDLSGDAEPLLEIET